MCIGFGLFGLWLFDIERYLVFLVGFGWVSL